VLLFKQPFDRNRRINHDHASSRVRCSRAASSSSSDEGTSSPPC
jgi:hypothetical protein